MGTNFFEMVQDDAKLLALIKRIKRAADQASRRGEELEEYVIMRKPPQQAGRPLVQLIEGLIPKGFDFYYTPRPGAIRKHQSTTKKKNKLRKRLR